MQQQYISRQERKKSQTLKNTKDVRESMRHAICTETCGIYSSDQPNTPNDFISTWQRVMLNAVH
jgi:hypothetical protein